MWVCDFEQTNVNITGNPAQDIFPMWTGNTIYFISDRDESGALTYMDMTSPVNRRGSTQALPISTFPSLGNDAIVFENGRYAIDSI